MATGYKQDTEVPMAASSNRLLGFLPNDKTSTERPQPTERGRKGRLPQRHTLTLNMGEDLTWPKGVVLRKVRMRWVGWTLFVQILPPGQPLSGLCLSCSFLGVVGTDSF